MNVICYLVSCYRNRFDSDVLVQVMKFIKVAVGEKPGARYVTGVKKLFGEKTLSTMHDLYFNFYFSNADETLKHAALT